MRGMLADVNVQGYLGRIRAHLEQVGLWEVLIESQLRFASFPEVGLDLNADDRSIWNLCQAEGWVLFTDNRNHEGADSLQATLNESWRPGDLPVLTLSNKQSFMSSPDYGRRLAISIANLLIGMLDGEIPRSGPDLRSPRLRTHQAFRAGSRTVLRASRVADRAATP